MKTLVIFLFYCLLPAGYCQLAPVLSECNFRGIPLHGKVCVVDIGEDFKIRIVDIGEDLRVKATEFPDECGEWQFVEIGEDFKIRYVEIGEDFKIRFTDFPGLPN
jgi:hypothetical protein